MLHVEISVFMPAHVATSLVQNSSQSALETPLLADRIPCSHMPNPQSLTNVTRPVQSVLIIYVMLDRLHYEFV